MVFDRKLIAVTNAMRVPPDATAAASKIDDELRAALDPRAPVYRLTFWPKHRAANHARVRDSAQDRFEQHGAAGAGLHHARLPGALAEGGLPGQHQWLDELGGRVFDRRRTDRRVEPG